MTYHTFPTSSTMMRPRRFVDPTGLAETVLSGPGFQFLWCVGVVRGLLSSEAT